MIFRPADNRARFTQYRSAFMDHTRFEALKKFVEASPNDCFVRYGLAQEYVRQRELEKALEQFNKILEINPDYQAAYYHGGQTCQKLGRIDEARKTYEKGIEVATRSGDLHAKSELEAALEDLPG